MKYEDGLNDMAGGKPLVKGTLEPPKHFDCRFTPEDIEKLSSLDINSYKGKWCMAFITKKGKTHSSVDPLVWNDKPAAEKEINEFMKGGYDLACGNEIIAKFEEIACGFPMPYSKT